MSTIVWPYGNQFRASRVDWGRKFNQRVSTSSLNGSVQTSDLPGTRWTLLMQFPAQTKADRRALMALIASLEGRRNRAQIWDFGCYVPQGNWTPSGVTVGSAAAQFAGSLTLAGCYGINLTKNPQDFGSATWSKSGGVTVTANTSDTTAPDATNTADRIDITSGGNRFISEASFWGSPNTETYKWRSVYAKAGTVWRVIFEGWSGTPFDLTAMTGPSGSVIEDVGNGWRRCSVRTTATIGNHAIYLDVIGTAVNAGYLYLWGGQVYRGSVLPAYTPYAQATPGDWLQVPTSTGNQLLQITADATANDAGQMTVPITPMLRGSVASGAAVTLSKPSALFILADPDNIMWPQEAGGICPPVTIEFMEVFS